MPRTWVGVILYCSTWPFRGTYLWIASDHLFASFLRIWVVTMFVNFSRRTSLRPDDVVLVVNTREVTCIGCFSKFAVPHC
jgi:hypothetical protein